MKNISILFIVLAVITGAMLAIAQIFDLTTIDQVKDWGMKIGLGLLVLYIVAIVISFLTRGGSPSNSSPN